MSSHRSNSDSADRQQICPELITPKPAFIPLQQRCELGSSKTKGVRIVIRQRAVSYSRQEVKALAGLALDVVAVSSVATGDQTGRAQLRRSLEQTFRAYSTEIARLAKKHGRYRSTMG